MRASIAVAESFNIVLEYPCVETTSRMMLKLSATAMLALMAACFVATEAFHSPANKLTTASTRSTPRVQTQMRASTKMEVWSEKNFRGTLLAGIGVPIIGVITPPDNVLASTLLPLAIAAIWIYIFVDVLKAAIPQEE